MTGQQADSISCLMATAARRPRARPRAADASAWRTRSRRCRRRSVSTPADIRGSPTARGMRSGSALRSESTVTSTTTCRGLRSTRWPSTSASVGRTTRRCCSTVSFLPPAGGTTSSSREARCASSGRKNTSSAGSLGGRRRHDSGDDLCDLAPHVVERPPGARLAATHDGAEPGDPRRVRAGRPVLAPVLTARSFARRASPGGCPPTVATMNGEPVASFPASPPAPSATRSASRETSSCRRTVGGSSSCAAAVGPIPSTACGSSTRQPARSASSPIPRCCWRAATSTSSRPRNEPDASVPASRRVVSRPLPPTRTSRSPPSPLPGGCSSPDSSAPVPASFRWPDRSSTPARTRLPGASPTSAGGCCASASSTVAGACSPAATTTSPTR